MGAPDGLLGAGAVEIEAQRQGVDEQPHVGIAAHAGVYATEQHGAEDHGLAAAGAGEHQRPGEVTEAREAYAEPAGLAAQPLVERWRQRSARLEDFAAVAIDVGEAEGSGGLVDAGEQGAEKALVLLGRNAQARLGDEVAERARRG